MNDLKKIKAMIYEIRRYYVNINIPILFVHGKQDIIIPKMG